MSGLHAKDILLDICLVYQKIDYMIVICWAYVGNESIKLHMTSTVYKHIRLLSSICQTYVWHMLRKIAYSKHSLKNSHIFVNICQVYDMNMTCICRTNRYMLTRLYKESHSFVVFHVICCDYVVTMSNICCYYDMTEQIIFKRWHMFSTY